MINGQAISNDKIETLKKLMCSLQLLYANDLFLFELDPDKSNSRSAHERAVTHKLAEYIQLHYQRPIVVDCEYNRHGLKIKQLIRARIFPDILVHMRGNDKDNILVIECKTSDDDERDDVEKLIQLTDLSNDYKYALGVFLRLKKAGVQQIRLFSEGTELDQSTLLDPNYCLQL